MKVINIAFSATLRVLEIQSQTMSEFQHNGVNEDGLLQFVVVNFFKKQLKNLRKTGFVVNITAVLSCFIFLKNTFV